MPIRAERAYYVRRTTESLEAASSAPDVCSRIAHWAFASAYDRRVEQIDADCAKRLSELIMPAETGARLP